MIHKRWLVMTPISQPQMTMSERFWTHWGAARQARRLRGRVRRC